MFILKFATTILLITICSFVDYVENKSVFGIGNRIEGDQLLVKDVLEAPPSGWSDKPRIRFNYAVPEPITYIEILCEENVFAEVDFNYKNELIAGTITAINRTSDNIIPTSEAPSSVEMASSAAVTELNKFEVLITIYGFNETTPDLNTGYVLNRDQDFTGLLQPEDSDEDYYNNDDDDDDEEEEEVDDEKQKQTTTERLTEEIDENDKDEAEDADDDEYDDDKDDAKNDDNNDDDDDDDFEGKDEIIELGYRQKGDYKIYETFQTSTTATKEATNHSVIFYYVDNNFITYAKFIIFDNDGNNSSVTQHKSLRRAEYSEFSPTTLKAIIIDPQTTSLFVQMFLYGYGPEDLPVDYGNYWEPPRRTALQRIKMLMNAQQHNDVDDGDDDDGSKENPTIIIKNEEKNGNADDDNEDDDDDDGDNKDEKDNNDNDVGGPNNNNNNLPLCINSAVTRPTNLSIMMLMTIIISFFSYSPSLPPSLSLIVSLKRY